jgi:predicted DNA-binding transcriptional regulator YafY
MLDTSSRLLRLLSLLQARRFWAGTDLAERLEVTPRPYFREIMARLELAAGTA